MTLPIPKTALAAACAASLVLAACGDDDTGDPIPNGVAADLIDQLDEFQDGLHAGDCDNIDPRIQNLLARVGDLDNSGVGADVQNALADGVDHLRDLANEACDREPEVETTPETTPEITDTVTTPTETVPPPIETTPEPEPVPEPLEEDPDEGDGAVEPPDGDLPPGQVKKLDGDD